VSHVFLQCMHLEPSMLIPDATQLLIAWQQGDKDALAKLTPLIHGELYRRARALMSQERADHTLQATALVNEAYMRLVDQKRVVWESRTHFYGIAAHLMRLILIDYARARQSEKRGGLLCKVSLDKVPEVASHETDIDLIDLEEALQELGEVGEQYVKIVELRYFGGLTIDEAAQALGISTGTVKRHWAFAKTWLQKRLMSE
jgi:RNA polymerase sigma factor (TIGR02999 family)